MLSLFLATRLSSAQEEREFSFLNIVNLIPGDVAADVSVGGKKLMPEGLAPASATGWFIVPTDHQAISVSLEQPDEDQPRIRRVTNQLPLVDGFSAVIVLYLHYEPGTRPDGTPFPPRIRMHSLPTFEGRGFVLKLVSLSPEIRRFQIGPNHLEAKPLETIDISNWNGGAFQVIHNGKPIGEMTTKSEHDSFYLIVSENPDGEFTTLVTSAGNQILPPWMKTRKPENQP